MWVQWRQQLYPRNFYGGGADASELLMRYLNDRHPRTVRSLHAQCSLCRCVLIRLQHVVFLWNSSKAVTE
jgi:hypothetical protein